MPTRRRRGEIELALSRLVAELSDDPVPGAGVYAVQAKKLAIVLDGAAPEPREQRSEIVGSLRAHGLSTRAIGAALGTSEATVRRDLPSASDDADGEPARVHSLDGRSRPATQPRPDPTPEPREYDGPPPQHIDEDRLINAIERRTPGRSGPFPASTSDGCT